MPSVIQRSFAGGELTPEAAARADQVKYQTGLRTCRNMIVLKHGGVANRAGFEFAVEVKDSTKATLARRFVFNSDQTYVLEFGDGYLRFIQDGVQLTVSGLAAYNAGTTYAVGDLVVSGGVNYYCILVGVGHTPASSPLYWYPLTGNVYEIPTPYVAADLAALQLKQSGDVITIVSRGYRPRDLSRLGQTRWTLTVLNTGSVIDPPTSVVATAGLPVSGSLTVPSGATAIGGDDATHPVVGDEYRVAAYSVSPDEIGVACSAVEAFSGGPLTHALATNALPVTVSWSAVIGASGYAIYKRNADGSYGIIGTTAGTSFIDNATITPGRAVSGTNDVASGGTLFVYVVTDIDAATGGESVASAEASCVGATPSSAHPNLITWAAVAGATEYNIYRKVDGLYAYIGQATGTTFDDVNYAPDKTIQPPVNSDPFAASGNWPQAIGYFQQRLVLASTDNDPERVRTSRTGEFRNFNTSTPLQDDDAVSFIVAGEEVNEVRHVFEVSGKFVILTAGGEWTISGDNAGTLKPTAINLRQQGYSGAAKGLQPLLIDESALFVQARGTSVIDIGYDITIDGFRGGDLSVFAQHLFQGFTLVDWAYARQPHRTVWIVRSDGALLGLTYLKDQQIWGWHRHDTGAGDVFESCTVVPEGDEDVLYVVVRRTVNGQTKRYIERLRSRVVEDVAADAFFVDSGATFDGTNTGGTTLTLSGGTTWSNAETLTLTASAALFTSDDVGNEFHLYHDYEDADGVDQRLTLRVLVTAFTSSTIVAVRATRALVVNADDDDYTVFRTGARTTWARAVDEVSGLGHLEGRTVAILADGFVEPQQAVASGTITLQHPAAIMHVGLPITADMELLDLEDPNGETLVARQKLIVDGTLQVRASGTFQAGPDVDHLKPMPLRAAEDWEDPTALRTGTVSLRLSASWDNVGRAFIRQSSPLPLEVLAVVRTGTLGGKQ